MKIDGSIRSNLISAISSVRRWRGRRVHKETIAYWHEVLEHGRRVAAGPLSEPIGELLAELENELALTKKGTTEVRNYADSKLRASR